MSNYVPHYTKKKQVLARKELALERRIANKDPIVKVMVSAGEVRDARIRVLQARRSTLPPTSNSYALCKKIDEQIEQLATTSLDSILLEFGYTTDDDNSS